MAKQATHTVVHGNLYLAVDGKLQHIPAGTQVILSKEQAVKASKDVYTPIKSDADVVDATPKADDKAKDKA